MGARDGGQMRAYLYRPERRTADGTILVAPGVHYDGPDDVRLDRLCRILAGSGRVVIAPFLRDFLALRVVPRAVTDLEDVFEALSALDDLPDTRPIVFSISFGSLPALRLVSGRNSERVARLVVFGGFADWRTSVEYCLSGDDGQGRFHGRRDPLNLPVVMINVCDSIPQARAHVDELRVAWREFCALTWGRPEMKAPGAALPVAEEIAETLVPSAREIFLLGCGTSGGAGDVVAAALDQGDWSHLDPRPWLHGARCAVDLIHGSDDDVIPATQMRALADAFPGHVDVRTHLTGLYGHTEKGGLGASPAAATREIATMARILRALSA